jgi:serine/threonine protein kinase
MIAECMCKLALGDLVGGETAEKLAGLGGVVGGVGLLLHRHFADHSQRLPNALRRSNQRAWKTLELALAGDGWLTRLKNLFARGEDKAIAEQIKAFLEANCLKELDTHPADLRRQCLEDLQRARADGVLEGGQVTAAAVVGDDAAWQKLKDPHERVHDDMNAVERMAAHLKNSGYEHLGWLLELQVHQRHSLLVAAVRYYFRREVEADRQLFQGLVFAQIEQIDEKQTQAFAALDAALANVGDRLDELLQTAGENLQVSKEARDAAVGAQSAARHGVDAAQAAHAEARKGGDAARGAQAAAQSGEIAARQGADAARDAQTAARSGEFAAQRAAAAASAGATAAKAGHDAVLDLREELLRQIEGLNQQQQAQHEQFYRPVLQMLEKLQMQSRPVQATDSMLIRTDRDREDVAAIVRHCRSLSPEQRRARPALVNGLGQLEFAVNDFENAHNAFAEVAAIAPSDRARALAHFNAYRAALERERFDDALAALLQAATHDPAQFTPFPLHRYEPKRILGAGGFGAAFLCHDRNFAADVVVKVLHGTDLDQGVEAIFREARLLKSLLHPNIIGIHDCEYADPIHRSRPYLVMDYFPGRTLEDDVARHGAIRLSEFLSIARPVALALEAAHRRQILHRDIKPANLLVRREDGAWQVRVIDFGLAMRQSVLSSASTSRALQGRTLAGASIAGTIDFAAPEQMGKLPDVPVGPPADVYGFGKTCYFMLLKTPEPDDDEKASLPERLRRLLGQCTARLPEKRPQSFRDVLSALDGMATRSSKSGKSATPPRPEPRPEPKRPAPPPPEKPLRAIPVQTIPPLPAVPAEPKPPPPPRLQPVVPVVLQPVTPQPVEVKLVEEVVPVRLSGAVPIAVPADSMTVRLFGAGLTPSWIERVAKTPQKIKVYFDDKLVGDGDSWKGIDLRVTTKPGKHILVLKALESEQAFAWTKDYQEVTKTFAVEFPEVGKFSVRFDYLDRGKLSLVTVDVIHAR